MVAVNGRDLFVGKNEGKAEAVGPEARRKALAAAAAAARRSAEQRVASAVDADGRTPLHLAAAAGDTAAAELLLVVGAPPQARDGVLRRTAGEAALANGHAALSRLVHEHACAAGVEDFSANNLRLLFNNPAPQQPTHTKWHFL